MTTLVAVCDGFCATVNTSRHRETGVVPAERLLVERERLHVLPSAPYAAGLGETRLVNTDQTMRFGSVRYSTPPGLVGAEVWVRAAGDELVVVADLNSLALRPSWAPAPPAGLVEVARHALSTPGRPRIELAHYPGHPQDPSGAPRPPTPRPTSAAETAFLALGPGAEAWLVEAAAAGAVRVRSSWPRSSWPRWPGARRSTPRSASRPRPGGSPITTCSRSCATAPPAQLVVADEAYSAQPGTAAWEGFGRGMVEDVSLPGRFAVRTGMEWPAVRELQLDPASVGRG
jgi:hypothetical protein